MAESGHYVIGSMNQYVPSTCSLLYTGYARKRDIKHALLVCGPAISQVVIGCHGHGIVLQQLSSYPNGFSSCIALKCSISLDHERPIACLVNALHIFRSDERI